MDNTLLIVNPVSGKGRVRTILLDILSALCAGGRDVRVCITEKRGDASDFAEKLGPEVQRIVCTGGDGSLNEVISGLMRLPPECRPSISYIPLGTTNDMATSLSIPKKPEEAIGHLVETGEHRPLDVGQLGQDYFGYVAAFGAFTDVPFTTPQAAKNTWGYLAYLMEALGQLTEITAHHCRVNYDDGYIEGDLLFGFVTNSLTVAGGIVKFDEDSVSLDDGLFEVLLIRKPRSLAELNTTLGNILKRNFSSENVTLLHTSRISFAFDGPVQWTRDGEDGGIYQSVDVVNHHQAVRIFVGGGV